MKKTSLSVFSLLFSAILFFGLTAVTFAAESTVTYTGKTDNFEFAPGSYYTDTDLFQNMKQIMPGDSVSQTVTVTNKCRDCDYVKIWFGNLLHDEQGNPISPKVLEEIKADERNQTLTEIQYMNDFLEQLTITITQDGKTLFTGAPCSLEKGFEDGAVFIGDLEYGDSVELDIQLDMDISIGNKYASRIGEMDLVFIVEEMEKTSSSEPGPGTGEDIKLWPYYLLIGAALVIVILLLLGKRKKQDNNK